MGSQIWIQAKLNTFIVYKDKETEVWSRDTLKHFIDQQHLENVC